MCECMECVSMNMIDTILSIIIILMNGIYVIWGLMLPHSSAKEVWKDYIDKLELYVNMVSYSDAVMLPLKIISMIIVKWCCCKCKQMLKEEDEFGNVVEQNMNSNVFGGCENGKCNGNCGVGGRGSINGISTLAGDRGSKVNSMNAGAIAGGGMLAINDICSSAKNVVIRGASPNGNGNKGSKFKSIPRSGTGTGMGSGTGTMKANSETGFNPSFSRGSMHGNVCGIESNYDNKRMKRCKSVSRFVHGGKKYGITKFKAGP